MRFSTYRLSYSYNLANELTSITGPSQFGSVQIGYDYDSNGRLHNVTEWGYANVSTYASNITYRAFGAVKAASFGDGHSLSTSYDNRMRPTSWNVASVLSYNYTYREHTNRVNYAQNINDPTLDRSYEYDQVGALGFARSGSEARVTFGLGGDWNTKDGPYSHQYDYDQFGNMTYRHGWGGEVQGGAPNGGDTDILHTYTNNRRDGFGYDLAGNLTNDLAQSYTYDGMGQQATATASGYFLSQGYDGDGLRSRKVENGVATYYLRSSVLGGAAVAEIDANGGWSRGYVYAGSNLLAVQQDGVYWSHEDDVTKSKRITDSNGNVVSTIELDPWGANTNRSTNSAFMPQSFTSYIRDANGGQDAMARRYSVGGRFSQPDPYAGSYDFSDPQSLNRYAYTKNDPVNFRDSSGLMPTICGLRETSSGLEYVHCLADAVFVLNSSFGGFAGVRSGGGQETAPTEPQNPAPTGRPSQTLAGCVFDVSITNNGLLNSKQLQAMKNEISRVFATAGQEINFVAGSNPNYDLSVNAVGSNYTNNSDAVGLTPLSGTAVTNNGRVFVDRLTSSATRDAASSTTFNQNSNALAVGLGRAGSHEISHYLLQQNYDSSAITGVMHSNFKGSEWFGKTSEGLWKFTPAQIKQLNSLCGR